MKLITRKDNKLVKQGNKLVPKEVLMMLINPLSNFWVEAKEATEAEYHRLRAHYGLKN